MLKLLKKQETQKEFIPAINNITADEEIEVAIKMLNARLICYQQMGKLTPAETKMLITLFERIRDFTIKKTKKIVGGYLQVGINDLLSGNIVVK